MTELPRKRQGKKANIEPPRAPTVTTDGKVLPTRDQSATRHTDEPLEGSSSVNVGAKKMAQQTQTARKTS